MGETVLSFHIHPGTNTCDGCEPGQVLAHIRKIREEKCEALKTYLNMFIKIKGTLRDQFFT